MRWIIESSQQFRFLVIVLAAALVFFGVTQLSKASVDVLPEFAPPYIEIQTEALGLSAEEVEQLITVPLEQDLINGVAWLEVIRSESVAGLSSVVLIFQPGTSLARARQLVAERLTQAANDLSATVIEMFDLYHPVIPADVGRLDVLERQIILDATNQDWTAAGNTLVKINTVWERVKPFVLARNGKKVSDQFDASLAVQSKALDAKNRTALTKEAENGLEIVDSLERLF